MTQWITMDVRNFDKEMKQKAIDWLVTKYKLKRDYIDRSYYTSCVGYYTFDNDDKYHRCLRVLSHSFTIPPSDIIVRMGCNNLGEM